VAVLENVSNWQSRLEEIADAAAPGTGNKARALSLLRDIEMFRVSLCRLARLDGEPVCDRAADDKPHDA